MALEGFRRTDPSVQHCVLDNPTIGAILAGGYSESLHQQLVTHRK
jgi:hypothetical protein